jgi:uncharacterized protein YegL
MAYESYRTGEYFQQQRHMLVNGDPRALICFCIDVSESMNEWWVERGGVRRTSGSSYSDGHKVQDFNPEDILPGYDHYVKIDKLNEVLGSLLRELKYDRDINKTVAVSIVVYSRFGRVIYNFLDCADLDINSCRCKVEEPCTSMGEGLRVAMQQIDDMTEELRYVDKDAYVPMLIFMTDGTPTDDPSREFAKVRRRVEEGSLHVFPLGIGEGADMTRLQELFPMGKAPSNFRTRYKMVQPRDYEVIFKEIKNHIHRKHRLMVTEENSIQSAPATTAISVLNNQTGETLALADLIL